MEKTLGRIAFEAYRAEVGTAVNGDPIPEWSAVGDRVRNGWETAAAAVATEATKLIRQGSRWVPLSEALLETRERVEGPAAVELEPADEATVERSRRVAVEADDETGDSAR